MRPWPAVPHPFVRGGGARADCRIFQQVNRMPVPRPLRRPSFLNSLGVSLFLWLFVVVLAAFAAYAFLSVRSTSRQLRATVESGALAWSELIKSATWFGMLRNHKEDVHEVIRTVAATPGVVGVRIYDKQGAIIYSADSREIGRQVDMKAESCVVCHNGEPPLSVVPKGERVRVFEGRDGHRVLGLINPIENSPACSDAGCHAHPRQQAVLGVLDVKMSMVEADSRLAAAKRQELTAAVLMALAVGTASALFIHRFVRRPVRSLIAGTQRIARGDLGATLEGGQNEIGRLGEAFNQMTRDLGRARQENEEWSHTLERKVMEKTEELAATQRQVVHMEKMASLGKLAATVAHELNNPLAGILNYAKLVARSLAEGDQGDTEENARFLRIIQQESSRCGEIVRSLLLFSRRSGGELAPHPLNPIVENALAIVRHHLEMSGVECAWTPLAVDDPLLCDAGQLQQALVALFVNAVEAMGPGGTLTVRACSVSEGVEITVADTGVGIPPESLPRIFEPFYSTKEQGSGVGLGLAVVYGIVERHQGRIAVDSEVGKGTVFRLTLPRRTVPQQQGEERST
jgi:two-component system NtrC family sensor kinase